MTENTKKMAVKFPNGNIVAVFDNRITTYVEIDLSDAIDNDLERFLDFISVLAVGSDLLMDIGYNVVGHRGSMITIEVTGDVSEVLKNDDVMIIA